MVFSQKLIDRYRLLSDDAPQFKKLTLEQALCWINEGRHYNDSELGARVEKRR
jgi:hypothetical protein